MHLVILYLLCELYPTFDIICWLTYLGLSRRQLIYPPTCSSLWNCLCLWKTKSAWYTSEWTTCASQHRKRPGKGRNTSYNYYKLVSKRLYTSVFMLYFLLVQMISEVICLLDIYLFVFPFEWERYYQIHSDIISLKMIVYISSFFFSL